MGFGEFGMMVAAGRRGRAGDRVVAGPRPAQARDHTMADASEEAKYRRSRKSVRIRTADKYSNVIDSTRRDQNVSNY